MLYFVKYINVIDYCYHVAIVSKALKWIVNFRFICFVGILSMVEADNKYKRTCMYLPLELNVDIF